MSVLRRTHGRRCGSRGEMAALARLAGAGAGTHTMQAVRNETAFAQLADVLTPVRMDRYLGVFGGTKMYEGWLRLDLNYTDMT